jgi:hypothetical protein
MSHHDDLHPDLQPVIDQLRANRTEATALELDAVKQRVRARVSAPARRRTRRSELMKSRLVVLTMLVLGMLLSTTGAGLAVSGTSGNSAGVAQYGKENPSTGGGGVLGDQDSGSGTEPASNPGGGDEADVQPTRQAEAGVGNNDSGGELPFTGFAAIPILLGGVVLLATGLVLRRRSSSDDGR